MIIWYPGIVSRYPTFLLDCEFWFRFGLQANSWFMTWLSMTWTLSTSDAPKRRELRPLPWRWLSAGRDPQCVGNSWMTVVNARAMNGRLWCQGGNVELDGLDVGCYWIFNYICPLIWVLIRAIALQMPRSLVFSTALRVTLHLAASHCSAGFGTEASTKRPDWSAEHCWADSHSESAESQCSMSSIPAGNLT